MDPPPILKPILPPILPRLRPCGDAGLSVEFGDAVDPRVNGLVLALDAAVAAAPFPGLIETVPTYRSLMLHYDPLTTDIAALERHVLALSAGLSPAGGQRRRWRVPVVYGGVFGVDLDELAEARGMAAAELIRQHAAPVYRIYMVGFLPGFAYLGGLDPGLHAPRRPSPRPVIPAQSVAIGGAQTAIGTVEGPSGWHLIGRTPVRGFQRGRDPVFLFEPGDEIVFEPVEAGRWDELDRRAQAGEAVATMTRER